MEYIWIFAAAVTLHNLEEFIWLPAWKKPETKIKIAAGKFEFRFAVVFLTALLWIITYGFYSHSKTGVWGYLLFGYMAGQGLNIIVPHLVISAKEKRYMPGLATGVLFVLPAALFFILTFIDAPFFDPVKYFAAAALFTIVMLASLPLLFRLGRMLKGGKIGGPD